jgi:hypothetical protein
MFKPAAVKFYVKALFLVLLLILTLLGAKGAFGAVSKKHDNSLGVVMQQTNPYTYLEGHVSDFSDVGQGINLRIQPRGMYSLFDQSVLFCDFENVAVNFQNKSGVVVLTYRTQAHRTIEGIGCHELISVDEVKEVKGFDVSN